MITVAGVCSGVGGFDLAFQMAGARVIWACEIDKSCRQVLAARFPDVPCYPDMLSDELLKAEAPDIFVGGTPCQGFSVAGLRKGLNDDRSNLALRFIELADHFNPSVILWENVDGVLSDKENAFGCFLAGLVGADAALVPTAECGGRWTNSGVAAGPKRTAAWRVLDSQYFGVAQRRNRVFVVASPGAELPFQILFEPEGVLRHSAPSREAGKAVAGTLGGSSQSGGFRTADLDNNGAFIAYGGGNAQSIEVATAKTSHAGRYDFDSETFVTAPLTSNPYGDHESRESLLVAHTLRADGFDASEDGTGRGTPLVPVSFRSEMGGNDGGVYQDGSTSTIAGAPPAVAFGIADDETAMRECLPTMATPSESGGGHPPAVAFTGLAQAGSGWAPPSCPTSENCALPLDTTRAQAIAFTERTRADGRNFECQEEVAYALTNPGSGGRTHSRQIAQGYAVRRLTPRECNRLQGFPDDWDLVPNAKGKPMADGPRYKMMGNAVTVSVVEWLARRILKAMNT